MMDTSKSRSYLKFKVMFWVTQGVGLLAVVLLCVWVFAYRGGLAWTSQPKLQFNWHVLSLPLGMIYLCALEIMLFRALRYGQKKKLKMLHAGFAVPILVLLVIGYWSILDLHISAGKINFYSLHSWLGILTAVFYIFQVVLGFTSYLWPLASASFRACYMPLHVFLGLTTFALGTISTLTGLFEVTKGIDGYSSFSFEGVMMNLCGMLFTVFTILVIYIQTRPNYKREPLLTD